MSSQEQAQDDWLMLELAGDAVIAVTAERPSLDADTERTVASLWAKAKARNSALFNGEVFSVDTITADRIEGHWTEYRRLVAQALQPSLMPILRTRPLAAAGLIETPDGFVFGERSADVVYQPSQWQLAPAGNVDPSAARDDRIDLTAALATELREELGLSMEDVSVPRLLCAVQHPRVGIIDICVTMRTKMPAKAILHAHRTRGDGEYPRIAIVPNEDLTIFLEGSSGPVAPQAKLFLGLYERANV